MWNVDILIWWHMLEHAFFLIGSVQFLFQNQKLHIALTQNQQQSLSDTGEICH
jgi:hypothetical protein